MSSCPKCGCEDVAFEGVLGRLLWRRCRDCGWLYSEEIEPEEIEDIEE